MADKNTLKNWFLTNLKPTQAQFWALFDSYYHKDEKIPITAIEDIDLILAEKADAEVVADHLTTATAHADLFNAKEDKTNKGVAGGYAPLNEFNKIAIEYLNVVNDLFTGGATALLSAEQGVVLQTQIESINTLLTSDNVNLDNVQEIVDAIETVQTSLETILVDDLTTGGTTKALTAEMGKTLKGLIDGLVVPTATDTVRGIVKTDVTVAEPVVYVKETVDELLNAKANYFLAIKPITGITYNVILDDVLNELVYDGTLPMNVIIPNNATLALPIGTIFYTVGTNTGVLSVSGGVGVVFQTAVGLSGAQNEVRKYTKRGINTWGVEGGVAATVATSLEYKKCYLKTTGNDSTAVIGSGSNPFLTLDGLIAKFMTVYGNTDNLQIIILDSGTYSITTKRTMSDFVIITNYLPIVKITEATTYTGTLFLEGKMELIVDPKIGSTTANAIFFNGVNTGLTYINIRKFNTGNTGYTPILHWQPTNQTFIKRLDVEEWAALGRFYCVDLKNTTINIGILSGYLPEAIFDTNTINIDNIYHTGSGVLNINPQSTTASKLRIKSSTVTNSAGLIALFFGGKTIELLGGIFQNTRFIGSPENVTNLNSKLTGFGILEWKKAIDLNGIIDFSASSNQRSNGATINVLENLSLIIRDTNNGIHLNSGVIFKAWCGINSPSGKGIFQNVTIEVQNSTCALFMIDVDGANEAADRHLIMFKGGCKFTSNGYFAKTRAGSGFTFTGYKSLVQLGQCVSHIGGLGLALETDITMTNIAIY